MPCLICWDGVTIRALVNQLLTTAFIHWFCSYKTPGGIAGVFYWEASIGGSFIYLQQDLCPRRTQTDIPGKSRGFGNSRFRRAEAIGKQQIVLCVLLHIRRSSPGSAGISVVLTLWLLVQPAVRLSLPDSLQSGCRNSSEMRRKGRDKGRVWKRTYAQCKTLSKKTKTRRLRISLNKRWTSDKERWNVKADPCCPNGQNGSNHPLF